MFRQWIVVTLILSLLSGNLLAFSFTANKIHDFNSDVDSHVFVVCTGTGVKFYDKAVYFETGQLVEVESSEFSSDDIPLIDCPLVYVAEQKSDAASIPSVSVNYSHLYVYSIQFTQHILRKSVRFILPNPRDPPVNAI